MLLPYRLNPILHERWDGGGYPDQLRGESIPLAARIIAVAEAYDFVLREHPYQTSYAPDEALAELRCCAGTQFDPMIVQVLQDVLTAQSEQSDLFRRLSVNGSV